MMKILENPFDKDKTVLRSIRITKHKKGLKFSPAVDLALLKFTYITVVKL